jgi:hypothetical protein
MRGRNFTHSFGAHEEREENARGDIHPTKTLTAMLRFTNVLEHRAKTIGFWGDNQLGPIGKHGTSQARRHR